MLNSLYIHYEWQCALTLTFSGLLVDEVVTRTCSIDDLYHQFTSANQLNILPDCAGESAHRYWWPEEKLVSGCRTWFIQRIRQGSATLYINSMAILLDKVIFLSMGPKANVSASGFLGLVNVIFHTLPYRNLIAT